MFPDNWFKWGELELRIEFKSTTASTQSRTKFHMEMQSSLSSRYKVVLKVSAGKVVSESCIIHNN